MQIHLM
jgi:hypothetical protein